MELLVHEDSKRLVTTLFDARTPQLPELQIGDALPLSVGLCDEIRFPFDSRQFKPQSLSGVTFRAAIGVGFLLPVDGKFTIAFANDDIVENTDFISGNPSAFEIEAALNALVGVDEIGGVTVTGQDDGLFVISFNNVGAREMLTGDGGSLVPSSILDFARSVTGDADTREVQTMRIVQNAAVLATLSTASAAASIAVVTVATGGAGVNHQVRITLTGNIYKGTWTFATSTGLSVPIGWDDSAAQIRDAIAAISGVGIGNVEVDQEDDGVFLVTFVGARAATAITGIAVVGTNLVAAQKKTGVLDLGQAAAQMLLNGAESRVVTLEIEKLSAGNDPIKVLRHDVLLKLPVIEPAMSDSTASDPSTPQVLPDITSLTGTDPEDLPSVATVGITAGNGVPYFIRHDGQFVPVYLETGAADVGDPGEVAPLDYHATTNNKHWTRGL